MTKPAELAFAVVVVVAVVVVELLLSVVPHPEKMATVSAITIRLLLR